MGTIETIVAVALMALLALAIVITAIALSINDEPCDEFWHTKSSDAKEREGGEDR